MKDRFVRLQLKELRKRPLTEEGVKDALLNAWEKGASTALFAPNWAYSGIAEEQREAYARLVLGAIAFNDYRDSHGHDPTPEKYRELVDELVEREKEIPFVTLVFGAGVNIWISGQSAN